MQLDESRAKTMVASTPSFVTFLTRNWPVVPPLLVLVIAGAATVIHGWYPVSDLALIELKTSDIPSRFPLLGAYSRMGWAHPGPAHFIWMAVPYRLFGSVGMPLAMLGLHGIATALIWRWTKQRDRLLGMLLMVGIAALFLLRPVVDLRSTWNPHVSLVITILLIVAVWKLIDGDTRSILITLPVSSLLVQSHLGNAVVLLGVLVGVIIAGIVTLVVQRDELRTRIRRALYRDRWWWIGGFSIAGLLWLPALIDQLTNDPGNIAAILTDPGDETTTPVSVGYAMQLYLNSFGLQPTWVGTPPLDRDGGLALGWNVPVWCVLPLIGIAITVWKKNVRQFRLLAMTIVAHLIACLSVTSYSGDLYPYLVVWLAPLSLTVLVASMWVIITHLIERYCSIEQPLMVVIGGCVVAISLWAAVLQTGDHQQFAQVQPPAKIFADEIIERAHGEAVFVDAQWDFDALAALPPLILEAENHGLDAITSQWQASGFGEHRVGEPGSRMQFQIAPTDWIPEGARQGWVPIRTVPLAEETDRDGESDTSDSLTLFIQE